MGWSSGTHLFDAVCGEVLVGRSKKIAKTDVIAILVAAMEDSDWDTHQDSEYWDHPVVQEVMRELHPDWFDDDGGEET